MSPRLLYGAEYNPEQWPRELWREDMRLMRLAGIDTVTLGVFGWSALQPDEDRFDFQWMDEAMDLLAAEGLAVILATPTAAQPAWMSERYPDVLKADVLGRRAPHGIRANFCPNSLVYRRFAAGIAENLATRYAPRPNVVLWHVNNEYGVWCLCETCADAFRRWLQARYGCLDAVNAAWWMTFWSHRYTSWSQVTPPYANGECWTPGLNVDYARFMSDSFLACYLNEAQVLRSIAPQIPVTTNMSASSLGTFDRARNETLIRGSFMVKTLNYHDWAPHLDVIGPDLYPRPAGDRAADAFVHALCRGLKDGRSWLLTETCPTSTNHQGELKAPGQNRLLCYQALAHGSDGVCYFQWRRCRGGYEAFHGAVVEHGGHEQTRVFREVAALGAEMRKLRGTFEGGLVPARVAMLYDWENRWALEETSGVLPMKAYFATEVKHYRPLWLRNIAADVVFAGSDWSRYDILIAPMLWMVKPGVADKCREFVRQGGFLLCTYLSGIADESNLVFADGYPGPLRETLGIWVEEHDALGAERNRIDPVGPASPLTRSHQCSRVCEVVHAQAADVAAVFGERFYAGRPALTVNRLGAGEAWYMASDPDEALLDELLAHLCARKGITPVLSAPPNIEVGERVSGSRRFVFLLNHSPETALVDLFTIGGRDLLADADVAGQVSLDGWGVRVIEVATTIAE